MGWIANGADGSEPVNALVNELINYLETKTWICQEYSGQARKCCNNIYSCFATLKTALLNIKLAHQGSQNIETACSQIQHQLDVVGNCIETQTGRCHFSLNRSNIRTPFYNTLTNLTTKLNRFCNKTTSTEPPPTTTTPEPSSTTSTTTPLTTITTSTSLVTSVSETTHKTTQSNTVVDADNELFRANNATSLPETTDDTIVITTSAVGATIFVAVIVVLVVVFCLRKRKPSTYGSDGSENSKKGFIWRWLHTSKPEDTQCADSEIYTEIDDAFMDAVYQLSREPASNVRDKIHHTAQINICYGTGMNDDDVILSKPEPIHAPPTLLEYENPNPLNPLELIRKRDDIITSFNRTPGTSPQKVNRAHTSGYQNVPKKIGSNAVLVLPNQKGYITSRPAFTAVNQSTSGGYVQIEATDASEQIYAEPAEVNSVYDTTSKCGLDRKVLSKSENVYNSLHTYETMLVSNRKQKRTQSSSENTEYQTKPNYLYENPCLEY